MDGDTFLFQTYKIYYGISFLLWCFKCETAYAEMDCTVLFMISHVTKYYPILQTPGGCFCGTESARRPLESASHNTYAKPSWTCITCMSHLCTLYRTEVQNIFNYVSFYLVNTYFLQFNFSLIQFSQVKFLPLSQKSPCVLNFASLMSNEIDTNLHLISVCTFQG